MLSLNRIEELWWLNGERLIIMFVPLLYRRELKMNRRLRDLYCCVLSYGDTIVGQRQEGKAYVFQMMWISAHEEMRFDIWLYNPPLIHGRKI